MASCSPSGACSLPPWRHCPSGVSCSSVQHGGGTVQALGVSPLSQKAGAPAAPASALATSPAVFPTTPKGFLAGHAPQMLWKSPSRCPHSQVSSPVLNSWCFLACVQVPARAAASSAP
eukprot:4487330-Pyramimonas_sp.AAC.1